MENLIVPVVTCPFCDAGKAAVAINLRPVRLAVHAEVCLDSRQPSHPAVEFRGGLPGPCSHMVYLVMWATWDRLAGRQRNPGGTSRFNWWHPAVNGVPVEQFKRFKIVGPKTRARLRPLATPFHIDRAEAKGVVEGRPVTRSWRWSVWGNALFASDATGLLDELRPTHIRLRRDFEV